MLLAVIVHERATTQPRETTRVRPFSSTYDSFVDVRRVKLVLFCIDFTLTSPVGHKDMSYMTVSYNKRIIFYGNIQDDGGEVEEILYLFLAVNAT